MIKSTTSQRQSFDGVICIGGQDWWYHNRGHFDFQVMRRLAREWPVLFVNSIAVRMPSLRDRALFVQRVGRKARSLTRGVTNVEHKFWVYSPLSIPGRTGQFCTKWTLAPQIKIAALRAGIRKPLLWVHCPAGAPLTDSMPSAAVVFQRTDRFEAFPEADPSVVGELVRHLKARADLVIYSSPHLMREEEEEVRNQVLVTHGVDYAMFADAAGTLDSQPTDLPPASGPRIGFVGGIDHHTFDPDLFLRIASSMPDARFVMVGGSSLPEGWCRLPNVTFLGRKPYEEVARYMAAMDVLIMPWNRSPWIEACNPIKLKEYLAAGRPVVSTDFPALDGWRDLVRVASTAEEFTDALRNALASPYHPQSARARVAAETWEAKTELVKAAILDLGLVFDCAASRRSTPWRGRGLAWLAQTPP